MNGHPVNPRATLWLFAYQGLTVETHISIVKELLRWPNLSHHVKGGDANIDRARSKVASWFLAEPDREAGSVLLMVDSDNAWETGGLAKLAKRALEHNAVVGGFYPKKTFGAGAALRLLPEVKGSYAIGEDNLVPCEFVGTGFIAIPRAVLEAVGERLPTVKGGFKPFFMPYVLPDPYQVEYPTDDQAFCARVREAGFKVLASTYPKLTHVGSYIYRLVDSDVCPPADRDVTLEFTGPKVLETVMS